VTNNNGFWIGWFDLLTPSFTITLNHNQFAAARNQWLPKTRLILTGLRLSSLLVFLLLWLTWFRFINHSLLLYGWIPNDAGRMNLYVRLIHESLLMNDWMRSSEFKVLLQPTVSRPVWLGVKHPSRAQDQIFNTVRQLQACWCGALSLSDERTGLPFGRVRVSSNNPVVSRYNLHFTY
jgi:hypothetical protein